MTTSGWHWKAMNEIWYTMFWYTIWCTEFEFDVIVDTYLSEGYINKAAIDSINIYVEFNDMIYIPGI